MKSRRRVLILESDHLISANLKRALNRRGYLVDWQVDPQAATNSLDSNLPDVIVSDLLLAGRSGIEFLYELRSYPDWQNIPVVIFSDVTAEEVNLDSAGFEQLSVSAFHYKPQTTMAELADSVDESLRTVKT